MHINTLIPNVESFYNSELWLRTIRDHSNILLRREDTTVVDVPPALRKPTRGDIKGFLLSVNIPPHYHSAIITLNGLEDPLAFIDVVSLAVPSEPAMSELRQKIRTTYIA